MEEREKRRDNEETKVKEKEGKVWRRKWRIREGPALA